MYRFICIYFDYVMLKKSLLIFLFVLFIFGALQANEYELIPSSWTFFKYHCSDSINVSIKNNSPYDYSTFSSVVKFDENDILVTHNSIGSFFNTMPVGYVSGNLYFAMWWNINGGVWDRTAATFNMITQADVSSSSTELEFVDNNWNPVFVFNTSDTDDWLTITSTDTPWDTLSWINNVTYYFEWYPCIDDGQAPEIENSQTWNDYIPSAIYGGRLTGIHDISMLVLDWQWTNGHYWYQGLSEILANYVPVGTNNVDNQYWVNSGTLNVRIDNSANGGSVEYPILSILTYTGTKSPHKYTWDSKDRWYWINFINLNPFEVEQQVVLTVRWYDNPNHFANVHLMTETFTFNNSSNPTINMLTPANGSTFQNTNISPLVFQADDAWAGVDTGSITIEIPAITSGAIQTLTGWIYSWTDLEFVLNHGSIWTGNEWWYEVLLVPKWEFPSDESISVWWFVSDLVWNNRTRSWSFTTRPDCVFYGCNNLLNVYIMEWVFAWGLPYVFTWELLIVTGTNSNSQYPYLTWINQDILMCGFPWTGAILDGSIPIYDNDGNTINWYLYTWDKLYITGADFTYNNGVITVH